MGNTSSNGPFSIAMLDYQSVTPRSPDFLFEEYKDGPGPKKPASYYQFSVKSLHL